MNSLPACLLATLRVGGKYQIKRQTSNSARLMYINKIESIVEMRLNRRCSLPSSIFLPILIPLTGFRFQNKSLCYLQKNTILMNVCIY